jgi:hypothetical protein
MLMQNPAWPGLEAYVNYFMLKHFAQTSIRRETEFATIWEAATIEGGRTYLTALMADMEKEAHKVEIN